MIILFFKNNLFYKLNFFYRAIIAKIANFFHSRVKMAATHAYHPKEAAAALITSSRPNMTIRLIALPRKTSMDLSTDNMVHLMIITDLADQSDVVA